MGCAESLHRHSRRLHWSELMRKSEQPATFVSYSREDSAFALQLARDLKSAGAKVWLDQLDIAPGERWDRTVQKALTVCPRILVLLSPAAVISENVLDEISFAIDECRTIIPVLYRDCSIPLRLRRLQRVDLRSDYPQGLNALLHRLDTPPHPDSRGLGPAKALDEAGAGKRRPARTARSNRAEADRDAHPTLGSVPENGQAKFALGVLYERGLSVPQDFAIARKWYETAALDGNATAMTWLGDLYFFGRGVSQSARKAKKWYEKGALAGSSEGMFNLGNFLQYGYLYYSGGKSDREAARQWYEQAATGGNSDAMVALGFLYQIGGGVKQDTAVAEDWYKKGAKARNGDAMAALGDLVLNGKNPKPDYSSAKKWYEQGVELGSAEAMGRLGRLYLYGSGVKRDYARARELCERAAALNTCNNEVYYNLGFMFLRGLGVTVDEGRGEYWNAVALSVSNGYPAKPCRLRLFELD